MLIARRVSADRVSTAVSRRHGHQRGRLPRTLEARVADAELKPGAC